MNNSELHQGLEDGIEGGAPFLALYALLAKFAAAGGRQHEAVHILEELRKTANEIDDDKLLELLDCVGGRCPLKYRLW